MAAHRDKFDCRTCRWGRHCDATNPAATDLWEVTDLDFRSRTCLLPMIAPLSTQLLMLYGHYKNGLLPFTGGLLEQPALFLRGMEIIEATLTRLQQDAARGRH